MFSIAGMLSSVLYDSALVGGDIELHHLISCCRQSSSCWRKSGICSCYLPALILKWKFRLCSGWGVWIWSQSWGQPPASHSWTAWHQSRSCWPGSICPAWSHSWPYDTVYDYVHKQTDLLWSHLKLSEEKWSVVYKSQVILMPLFFFLLMQVWFGCIIDSFWLVA